MTRARKTANKAKGQIRVIAGQHRGRKLPVLDVSGLRPTTDRQKETLFNWLMNDVSNANCLDVFSGAGSLGIEALSRGAKQVYFIEKDKSAARQIQSNLDTLGYSKTQASLVCGDALEQLKTNTAILASTVDIVFIDPPFNHGLVPNTLSLIESKLTLNKGAKIYIEIEIQAAQLNVPSSWKLIKQSASQQSKASLYEYLG